MAGALFWIALAVYMAINCPLPALFDDFNAPYPYPYRLSLSLPEPEPGSPGPVPLRTNLT